MTLRPFRSLLFVPGNQANMLEKALGFRPDAFVPDLEDSVPDAEKATARAVVRDFLPRLAETGVLVIPRVNARHTPWFDDDLASVVGPHVVGVSVGKIQTKSDIGHLAADLSILEREGGLEDGRIGLIPWIESAEAVLRCSEICGASPRVIGVAFGAEDFTHDMGIERLDGPEGAWQLTPVRSQICVAARAAGVLAFETPYFKFRDDAGLRVDCRAARQCGFRGRFAIHPAQIDGINETFSPSAAEIAHARRVVAAYEEAERAGRGSTSLDGLVVDVPVVKRARALLALAESLGVSDA